MAQFEALPQLIDITDHLYDKIPADSPLRILYESDELTRFVGRALGLEQVYRHGDELGALNVMLYEPGDELGWHFDGADFVVTLMLQPPLAGGALSTCRCSARPTTRTTTE